MVRFGYFFIRQKQITYIKSFRIGEKIVKLTRKPVTLLVVSILCFSTLTALNCVAPAAAATLGQWSYGGIKYDCGTGIVNTSDGGYALAGLTYSQGSGESDLWLVKVDASGNMQWNKTFGGAQEDVGYSLVQSNDGGYAIVGSTISYGSGGNDIWLIKTDSSGNLQWDKTYGGAGDDYGWNLEKTSDGGYLITGYTTSYGSGMNDGWIIKVDSQGNIQWSQTFGGSGSDATLQGIQTSDGGYAFTGYTNSSGAGKADLWLVKISSTGSLEWDKTYGGIFDECGYALVQTSDGGYTIVGETASYGSSGHAGDVWLLKVDSEGNKLWSQTYGGSAEDAGWDLIQTSDGGYAITGYTYSKSSDGSSDVWLIKTDSDGVLQWDQTFGGATDNCGWSLVETSDSAYAIVGGVETAGGASGNLLLIVTDATAVQNTDDSSSTPLTTIAIVIVFVALVAILAVLLLIRKRRSKQAED